MFISRKVAVYFVASPLQYLAAQKIAEVFEPDARQVLVWYKPGLKSIVNKQEWDACAYMPWPRLEPLPGMFGRHRRLRANIKLVASLIGSCEELLLHSAVFDTEAINYFLKALPKICGSNKMHARIIPDGLISTRRYPLSFTKKVFQHLRKLRSLIDPELKYSTFKGDRIGSDAKFCDYIYVLPGLPQEYPKVKIRALPPLVKKYSLKADGSSTLKSTEKRALVIGQPLTSAGILIKKDVENVSEEIKIWLKSQKIDKIFYKQHPKDPSKDLWDAAYKMVDPLLPLELHMSNHYYDAVVGVRSSALLLARQIYPDSVTVKAFGWNLINFKSASEKQDMEKVFSMSQVDFK